MPLRRRGGPAKEVWKVFNVGITRVKVLRSVEDIAATKGRSNRKWQFFIVCWVPIREQKEDHRQSVDVGVVLDMYGAYST